MYRGAKTISNSLRPRISTLKNLIRFSTCGFDGDRDSHVFKTALKELRQEGLKIKYVKEKCHYILEN